MLLNGAVEIVKIHWPVSLKRGLIGFKPEYLTQPDIPSTWRAMETLYDSGKARAIGVSNFSTKKLGDLLKVARVPPAVNQVECHPSWQQPQLHSFCKSNGVHLSVSMLIKSTWISLLGWTCIKQNREVHFKYFRLRKWTCYKMLLKRNGLKSSPCICRQPTDDYLMMTMSFLDFRRMHQWVPQVAHLARAGSSLRILFSIWLQRNWASLLHKLLFGGGCRWVTACYQRAQTRVDSRKILMFLTGLYLKTSLPSSQKLSRPVVSLNYFNLSLLSINVCLWSLRS